MKYTHNTTSSIAEINTLSQSSTASTLEIGACDLADVVGLLLYLSSELEHMIELVKILADGNICAQLENKQRFALALSVINKGEYLADLAFGDAQSLNEHLKGTGHYKDFIEMLSRGISDKQQISLIASNKG